MTQNIYDNAQFFERYSQLPRSVEGLEGAPEWPALRALLPDLGGAKVADLGCGFGWFCRWARGQGAAEVLGVDVSERMLARARTDTRDMAITYVRADMERLALPAASFDLIYSSLALHYIEHLRALLAEVHRALVPGGRLVFSVEHPVFTAPAEPGWSVNPSGRKSWALDAYLEEGPRSTDWLAKGVIKQHRTLATYINILLRLGLSISEINEWGPTPRQIASQPDWVDERERPAFLLVAARG